MMSKVLIAGLAYTVTFAAAWTQPGNGPEGNPIYTPGSTSIVPVGSPYDITWEPTTNGTVTLLLLKGPSTNAVPQYAIVEKLANTGSYSWTPATDLAPGTSGYGIELIDDATGQYQYSTQFGISNDDYSSSSSAASSAATTESGTWGPGGPGAHPTGSAWPTESGAWTTTGTDSWTTTDSSSWTTTTSESSAIMTTPAAATWTTSSVVPSNATATWKATSATSSKAATTTSSPVAATGAASSMAASFGGLVLAAGVAVLAL